MLDKKLLYLIVILFPLCACADSATDTTLKIIMQDLYKDTSTVLEGLLIEDYDAIADAAASIADHPRIPPAQVRQVATELGTDMAIFKQFDTAVHDLSLAIRAAALNKDLDQTMASYQQMIGNCIACHTSFRQRVSTVLNPAQ